MKKGIDVSYANGRLDWSRLKASGVEFAVIRSSFGSDDPDQVDNQFHNNARGCAENGIPFMTYHFAYFINQQKASEEADFAIRLAREYPQVKAIALDIEEDSQRFASLMGADPDWTECARIFMDKVESAGYKAVLYTNYSFMTYVYDYDKLKKYPLWLASPGASESTVMQYNNLFMWQYSWEGRPDGSNDYTDMDYCYDMSIITGTNSTGSSSGTGSQQSNPSEGLGQVNSSAEVDFDVKVISPDGVNIRSGASVSYNILGAVPCGETVHKPDELGQVNSSAEVDFDVKVISLDGVNIRSGASVSYRILGAVPCGETVHITRRTSGGGYIWGLTDYCGVRGWIALDFCARID